MKFKLKTGQGILIYIAAGVFLAIFPAQFIFLGLGRYFRQLDRQIELKEIELSNALKLEITKDAAIAGYEKYKPYLGQASAGKGNLTSEEKLLKEVESIAGKSNVTIISLAPRHGCQQLEEYKKYKADLRIESSAAGIMNFLENVEDSAALIKLDRLTLTPKDGQPGILRLEAVVSLAVF